MDTVYTPLHRLQELGQSVWYDNIRRALLDSGLVAANLQHSPANMGYFALWMA